MIDSPDRLNVSSRYGAPMGRQSYRPDADETTRVRLTRVPLNSGGYDRGGAYWGHGDPIFCVWADESSNNEGQLTHYVRAANRKHAKDQILGIWPLLRFYR